MVLASPLLTRLYTPDDFGVLAIYGALLALFTVVAGFRYELAIPLPSSNSEAVNVVILSLMGVIVMSCISSVIVLIAGDRIAVALGAPVMASFFWLLPIGVLLSGIYKIFNYWAVRSKTFNEIAKTQFVLTCVILVVQMLGFKLGGVALITGQLSGQFIGSLRLVKSAFRSKEFLSWNWSSVWVVAKRYKQFPLYSTWSGLFNAAGTQLPPLVLAFLFNTGSVGLYALANRVLGVPMAILGNAVGQVYFSNLAESNREGKLGLAVEQGFLTLLKISMPAVAIFMLFAPDLFSFAFGDQWKIAGLIAFWMSPWLLLQFISSPLSTVYFVLEKENLGLYFQVFMFTVRLIALFVGYNYFNFLDTLIIFSAVSAGCYLVYNLHILWISGGNLEKSIVDFFKEFLLVALLVAPIGYFNQSLDLVLELVLAVLVLVVFYVPRLRALYN